MAKLRFTHKAPKFKAKATADTEEQQDQLRETTKKRLFNREEQAKLEEVMEQRKAAGIADRKPRNSRRWIPDEKDMEKITFLSGTGLNQEQVSYMLDIDPSTLLRAMQEEAKTGKPKVEGSAGIAAALKKGRAKGVSLVVNSLFQSATGGNLGAQCFYLKNNAGWRDHADVELSGKGGAPIAVTFNKLQKEF